MTDAAPEQPPNQGGQPPPVDAGAPADAAASAEPGAEGEGAADPPQEQEWEESQADEWRFARRVYLNVTNNNFNAEVDAAEAVFGTTSGPVSGRTPRRATGLLDPDEVDEALRGFVPPESFEVTLGRLLDGHLLVSVGREGSGRRTGALAMLRRAVGDGKAVTSMSPAHSFAELAGRARFESGRGYLVQDHIGDSEAAAVREFECARLADKLRGDGAFLVVTATADVVPRGTLRRFSRQWRGPDLAELLDAAARDAGIDEPTLATARAMVGQLDTPYEVVSLVRCLAADPADALDALGNSAKEQVSRWFDDKPGKREIMAIAVLAFLHRVPERTFEGCLARLLELAEDEPDKTDELPQRRLDIARGHPLVTAERIPLFGASGLVTERVVAFHSARHRSQVMAELCDRYGYELWEPLRCWLDEVAVSDDAAARVELALGMARLAEVSFGEVADFLDRWADGDSAGRLTAAIALWGMCSENGMAPLALRLALHWVRDRGQNRAITAAMALGGDLGLLYPSDALRWLWFLARRSERIGAVARLSIAFLFSAGVEDPARCTAVFAQARSNLREVTAEDDQRSVRAVRQAVVCLLGVPRIDTDEPAVATVVRGQPGSLRVLGALWADVLCSAPNRREAFDALVDCLVAIERDRRPDSREQVSRLGAALLGGMPQWHRQALRRDLMHAATDDHATTRPPDDLVEALLAAMDGNT